MLATFFYLQNNSITPKLMVTWKNSEEVRNAFEDSLFSLECHTAEGKLKDPYIPGFTKGRLPSPPQDS